MNINISTYLKQFDKLLFAKNIYQSFIWVYFFISISTFIVVYNAV